MANMCEEIKKKKKIMSSAIPSQRTLAPVSTQYDVYDRVIKYDVGSTLFPYEREKPNPLRIM